MSGRAKTWFLLTVGGLGGLLYGIDFGVIAVSMPYIKALRIYTDAEVSWIVGAVMFGGSIASATAGVLCDRLGRKPMISAAAALFLAAIPVVCLSGTSLAVMLAGRVLQGMSAGYMAVVMPMYLAETLPPDLRGRGTGIFQLFLGIGLVTAAAVGILISAAYGAADSAAADAAKSLAWRVNFWWTMAPVAVLFVCSLRLAESPVWLARKAGAPQPSASSSQPSTTVSSTPDLPLLSRRYVVPFVLAVLVLTFNKTIGMSSIVAYAVSLFQKAGLSGALANVGDLSLKGTNLAVTLLAVALVDRKGRTWLLKVGTAGMTAGLFLIGGLFLAIERGWMPASRVSGFVTLGAFLAMQAFYSLGPGICVWLVLSELMPARIRANGMAIALFANQFVAWGLASSFFPMVNAWGYGPVFFGFAVSGVLYFLTVLFIPETKGLSLDAIERLFDRRER
jgi:MFS family permease